jgi:uroporphyrinogen-III synthase
LAGKRIVVTRAEEQARELADLLSEAGAVPVLYPSIRIAPPESVDALDAALDQIARYRWVVFTSSNGVRAVVGRLAARGGSAVELGVARVAAVGASTAAALADLGVEADFVPSVERSRALADELPDVEGARVLLTRADIASPRLAQTLRARGATRVDDVIAYRTLLMAPASEGLEELRRGVDGITFTSPSTVRGCLQAGAELRDILRGVPVFTLGPATTEAVRGEGLEIAAEATERSMRGLVDVLRRVFESPPGVGEERGT